MFITHFQNSLLYLLHEMMESEKPTLGNSFKLYIVSFQSCAAKYVIQFLRCEILIKFSWKELLKLLSSLDSIQTFSRGARKHVFDVLQGPNFVLNIWTMQNYWDCKMGVLFGKIEFDCNFMSHS